MKGGGSARLETVEPHPLPAKMNDMRLRPQPMWESMMKMVSFGWTTSQKGQVPGAQEAAPPQPWLNPQMVMKSS